MTEALSALSSRAILEFEDVQQKYKEFFEKFQQEEAKRRKFEAQFKQLKQVSLLAVAEYESLHKQYLTENQYRQHIEERLRKVTEENQEIRKQNKLGANTTIVSQNSINNGTGGVQETKGELEVLRAMKDAINNELRAAKNEVTKLKEELLAEQKAHEVTKNQLDLGQKQMKQLNRVSVLALNEYNDLKRKFEIEETNRRTAEDVATEIVQKQQMEQRKLSIINETAQKDDQIKKFLEEIDQLNETIRNERKENSDKIKELEEELTHTQESGGSKELEEKLSLLMAQLDIAQKEVVEATSRAEKSEYDTRQLYVRLSQAERLIDSSKNVPLPPPPPPPPPPIAAPVIRKFITRIGKGRRKDLPKEQEEDPRIEAMTAMIERIKKGVKLRSVASPAKPVGSEGEGEKQEDGAMGELAGLLSNMKRGRRGTEDSIDAPETEKKPEPEFARVKLKKTGSVQRSVDGISQDASSELKKKLEKQKSVADGIAEESTNNDANSAADAIKIDDKEKENVATKKSEPDSPVSPADSKSINEEISSSVAAATENKISDELSTKAAPELSEDETPSGDQANPGNNAENATAVDSTGNVDKEQQEDINDASNIDSKVEEKVIEVSSPLQTDGSNDALKTEDVDATTKSEGSDEKNDGLKEDEKIEEPSSPSYQVI